MAKVNEKKNFTEQENTDQIRLNKLRLDQIDQIRLDQIKKIKKNSKN